MLDSRVHCILLDSFIVYLPLLQLQLVLLVLLLLLDGEVRVGGALHCLLEVGFDEALLLHAFHRDVIVVVLLGNLTLLLLLHLLLHELALAFLA